jgi:hypothetical protein
VEDGRGTMAASSSSIVGKKLEEATREGLRELLLVDCFIGDEGCTAVSEALKNNYVIRSLDLRGCNVRESGATQLASVLRTNQTLTQLGLEWNNVGNKDAGIEALCKVLARLFGVLMHPDPPRACLAPRVFFGLVVLGKHICMHTYTYHVYVFTKLACMRTHTYSHIHACLHACIRV